MLTLLHKEEVEPIINKGIEDVRIIVKPNLITKFSLYLTGAAYKGVEIIGVGPAAMRVYYSLIEYAWLVGFGLEKGYRVFIRKDGTMFSNGDWYIEFRLVAKHLDSKKNKKGFEMKSDKIYQIFLMTFFGMLGSILIGFIFFDTSVFIPKRTNFQFVTFGLYGSLFFSLLEYRDKRDRIYSIVVLFILNLIIFTGRYISIAYIIRDLFYSGALFLSIKLYHQFIKRNSGIKLYLRSFALVLFYGLINTVFASIVFLINANAGFPPVDFIYARARDGILIGFGIGLGIDFYLQNKKHLFNLLKIKSA
jgi:hypothetical protein